MGVRKEVGVQSGVDGLDHHKASHVAITTGVEGTRETFFQTWIPLLPQEQ